MKFDVPSYVINKLFDQGYENQIVDVVMACENDNNCEVSDIPLSPILMKNSSDIVILNSKVYEVYCSLVERIQNNLNADEIPFFLLGNRKKINGNDCIFIEDIICDFDSALSQTYVRNDQKKFEMLLNESSYSVISIGHTHGNVDKKIKDFSLTKRLPDELKKNYSIRETGLNISVADIWQHEAFKQIAINKSSTKEIMQTIIMYNGDMIMISFNDILKVENIHSVLKDGSKVMIPTGRDKQDLYKHVK